MVTRRRLAALPPLALIAVAGCSADEGGLGKPTVDAGPVANISFVFTNPGAEDLYVDWPTTQPRLVIKRNETVLITQRGCLPFCGDGCNCSPCPPTSTRVKRVPAGGSLTVPWKPIRYAVNACGGSESCTCIESWPVTAGHYEVSLAGFTHATGGEPSPEDPDLLIGAQTSPESRSCTARKAFDLEGGATVSANFVCP